VIDVNLHGTGDQWSFRRLPETLAQLDLHPKHVLHVGANLGQEVPDYRRAGIERITLVEPDPDTAAKLREAYPDLPVIEAACGTAAGAGVLRRIAGADVWSTLATSPMPHDYEVTDESPVTVLTVAQVQAEAGSVDMLVIDTQGTELDALRSADLSTVAVVVIETQEVSQSAHAGYWPDVAAYMANCGWKPVVQWRHETPGEYFATFADTFFIPA
jgi:FkbM family methyltransferase